MLLGYNFIPYTNIIGGIILYLVNNTNKHNTKDNDSQNEEHVLSILQIQDITVDNVYRKWYTVYINKGGAIMSTKATRSVSSRLHNYATQHRSEIKTPEFVELAKFSALLHVMSIDSELSSTIKSSKKTLNLPFNTTLTGDEISGGFYLHKLLSENEQRNEQRNETITSMSEVFKQTYEHTLVAYKNMKGKSKKKTTTSKTNKRANATSSARDVKSSTRKKIPQAAQANPPRQVMSHSVLAVEGKDILLTYPVAERGEIVSEYALRFESNPPQNSTIAQHGLTDKKVLLQVSMPKMMLSPKQLEQALIMIALEHKQEDTQHDN